MAEDFVCYSVVLLESPSQGEFWELKGENGVAMIDSAQIRDKRYRPEDFGGKIKIRYTFEVSPRRHKVTFVHK